jgi:hypothetical protein
MFITRMIMSSNRRCDRAGKVRATGKSPLQEKKKGAIKAPMKLLL